MDRFVVSRGPDDVLIGPRNSPPGGRYEYATEEKVVLEPLPCWRHLPIKEVRRRVKDLIREVERTAATERRAKKKTVLGAEAVMEVDPQYRPAKLDRSPAPDFHARHK